MVPWSCFDNRLLCLRSSRSTIPVTALQTCRGGLHLWFLKGHSQKTESQNTTKNSKSKPSECVSSKINWNYRFHNYSHPFKAIFDLPTVTINSKLLHMVTGSLLLPCNLLDMNMYCNYMALALWLKWLHGYLYPSKQR